MSDHDFCRSILRETMVGVRQVTTVAERKAAWAWRSDLLSRSGEFHGPDDFYWHGNSCCLWHAKSQGWTVWLQSKGLET